MENRTVGISPKAPAAGVSAVVAALVVALVAEQFDTKLDVNTVQAVIGAVVAGIGALVGAIAAKPGSVVARRDYERSDFGYALVELLIGAILLLVFIWLVFALVD